MAFVGCDDGSGLFGWRGIGGFHEPIGAIISPSTPETGFFFDFTLQQSSSSTAELEFKLMKRFQFFLIEITTIPHLCWNNLSTEIRHASNDRVCKFCVVHRYAEYELLSRN